LLSISEAGRFCSAKPAGEEVVGFLDSEPATGDINWRKGLTPVAELIAVGIVDCDAA